MQADWIERETTKMLAKAKATGYFQEIIEDAKYFEAAGYVWDVALKMALNYWAN